MKKAHLPGGGRMHTVKTPKVAVDGSKFGLCMCGIPQTKTIPCPHMLAVVQSGTVENLTPLLIMPVWCSTDVWRK